jgi:hypothetical protein
MSSLPRDAAERVLRLAIEMQSRRGEHLTEREMHDIARQVGIEPEHLRAALAVEHAREAARQRTAVANAAAEAGPKPPRDVGQIIYVVFMTVGFTAFAIPLTPEVIQAFSEADSTPEYLALPLWVVTWAITMFPLGLVVFMGVQKFRRRGR